MLENISRAITTALFFLCTAIVGGIEPAESAPTAETCQPISAETSIDKYSDFSLSGSWNSGGRVFEFTKTGKLLFGDTVMKYTVDGNFINISADVNGQRREYTAPFEILGDRLMKIGGVTFYKTN